MLIKNISKLSDFGIFSNCNNSDVCDFGKYNLFYGWNGAGKSTLSSLFRCLEQKSASEKFPSAKFTFNLTDGTTITQSNIQQTSLNVHTFNQEFIDENISWNSVVKSLLLVDKKKIAEREKLEDLKKQQSTDITLYLKEKQEIQKQEDLIAKFGTNSARHLKTSLQSIDTTDSYFLNYDKRKFEALVNNALDAANLDDVILDDKQIKSLTNAAKPIHKPVLSVSITIINGESFEKARARLLDILGTSIVSNTLQRLAKNTDIKTWVESGIMLHQNHQSTNCEFCGSNIPADRIASLEAHFNDEYKAFQERLARASQWLLSQYIQPFDMPAASELYDEFAHEFIDTCKLLQEKIASLNEQISKWHNTLKSKTENPLLSGLSVEEITSESIQAVNSAVTRFNSILAKHNNKSNNFQQETTKVKKQLEVHYVAAEVKEFDLYAKRVEITTRLANNQQLNNKIAKCSTSIKTLEDALSNESLGAGAFNECLHKFLGRAELTLNFSPQKKGYEILRNGSDQVNGKLSEGEKTAIAFVYFIIKLKENSNRIDDSIVVVDDPVSSFDSNHLFHAYSFLKSNCTEAKQIFVLTHNFTYFKLVRDWFDGINKNRKRKQPQRDPNAFFFTIEASPSIPRQSSIRNAHTSLSGYNSEYHYIFAKLHFYKNNVALSRDDAFLAANLSRKLLESFFSFKFPKNRTDIAQLMDRGLKGCKVTDENTKEKIYRFINKYSHSATIEMNEDSAENLAGEGQNIVSDIFEWVREVDEVHYNEMVEVVG